MDQPYAYLARVELVLQARDEKERMESSLRKSKEDLKSRGSQ